MFNRLKQYFSKPIPEPPLLFSKIEMGPRDILIIHLPTAVDRLDPAERTRYMESVLKVAQNTPTLDSRRVWVMASNVKISVISQAEIKLVLGT